MRHVPPWATGTRAQQEQHAKDLVDAAWLDVGGRNAGVMNLPVVKVDPRSEENSNHWRCEELEAVPVGLVLFYGHACQPSERHKWQQVLVRDVSVFKPDLEPTFDSKPS